MGEGERPPLYPVAVGVMQDISPYRFYQNPPKQVDLNLVLLAVSRNHWKA